jgi:F-box-like
MNELPSDILHKVFTFLIEPNDLEACSNVNRCWNEIANSIDLWRLIAILKYGEDVTDNTIHFYNNDNKNSNKNINNNHNNWKDLLFDDNSKGALRVLTIDRPCYWRANGMWNMNYCCIVQSIFWHRNCGIYLSIDARGETDLRHPSTSSISLQNASYMLPTEWINILPDPPSLGHFQGLLFYPIRDDYDINCNINFSYACETHYLDYNIIPLLQGDLDTIKWDGYITRDDMIHTIMNSQNDVKEERKQWEKVFPLEILNRPGWWK